jgi:hypothetical protein
MALAQRTQNSLVVAQVARTTFKTCALRLATDIEGAFNVAVRTQRCADNHRAYSLHVESTLQDVRQITMYARGYISAYTDYHTH